MRSPFLFFLLVCVAIGLFPDMLAPYDRYTDFGRKYIWPGTVLPSVTAVVDAARKGHKGKMSIESVEDVRHTFHFSNFCLFCLCRLARGGGLDLAPLDRADPIAHRRVDSLSVLDMWPR